VVVNKSGFSLIELIVVIGLLSLLTLAISSIMLTSVMTSARIRTATKVKQAGNYAIGQLQGLLRNAKLVTSCDSANNTITIVNPDGGTTQILAELDDQGVTRIASNSGVYLTPVSINANTFSLICDPSDTEPTLVKLAFDLQDTQTAKATQNPILHFETSTNLRNE